MKDLEKSDIFSVEEEVYRGFLCFIDPTKAKGAREFLTGWYCGALARLFEVDEDMARHKKLREALEGFMDCFRKDMQSEIPKDARNIMRMIDWYMTKCKDLDDLEEDLTAVDQKGWALEVRQKAKLKIFYAYKHRVRSNYSMLKLRIDQHESGAVIIK